MKVHARAMMLALGLATLAGGWSVSAQAEPTGGSARLAAATTVPQPPHRPLLKPERRGIEVASSQAWDSDIPVCVRINCNQIFLSGIGF
jgi:hypothetical protein